MSHIHTTFSRRDFLRFSSALGLGAVLGPQLNSILPNVVSGNKVHWDRQVIFIELDGGNDGLNTVVPYEDSQYNNLRDALRLKEGDLGKWSNLRNDGMNFGMHPEFSPLKKLWDDGDMAIHQGLGYPSNSRSHFRGIDIWNSASGLNEFVDTGWFGRLIQDESPPSAVRGEAVLLRRPRSNPAKFDGVRAFGMDEPRKFAEDGMQIELATADTGNFALDFIIDLQNQILGAAGEINSSLGTSYVVDPSDFPVGDLGDQLHRAAELIVSGMQFPLYKCSLDGFDTHASQDEDHAPLLAQVAGGVRALRDALVSAGKWNSTLVVTYAEFGRRVAENGSLGTDHGSAAPHFFFGGDLSNPGLHGTNPDLSQESLDANRGDVPWTDDFRRIYATAGSFLGFTSNDLRDALSNADNGHWGADYFKPLPCL